MRKTRNLARSSARLADTHIEVSEPIINRTLLRYVLKRLGRAGDESQAKLALDVLRFHPDETMTALTYLGEIGHHGEVERTLIDNTYPYQVYQMLGWRRTLDAVPSAPFLAWARRIVLSSQHHVARSMARACLGKWGTAADLHQIESAYAQARHDQERAEIVCCLSRVEKSHRNAFLRKVANDGPMVSRACSAVTEGSIDFGG